MLGVSEVTSGRQPVQTFRVCVEDRTRPCEPNNQMEIEPAARAGTKQFTAVLFRSCAGRTEVSTEHESNNSSDDLDVTVTTVDMND